MELPKNHIRHVLLFCHETGKNASQAHRDLTQAYGDEAPSVETCRRWYARFRAGDLSLQDLPKSGRPVAVDDEDLLEAIQADPELTTREIGETLGVHFTTVTRRLHALGWHRRQGKWVKK